jgi:hypothetical protein
VRRLGIDEVEGTTPARVAYLRPRSHAFILAVYPSGLRVFCGRKSE